MFAAMVARHATSVRRYPDSSVARDALAAAMAVDPARVVLTNGGAEAIALVAAHLPVGNVESPDFSLYEKHLAQVQPGAPLWRSNPNNPTGRLAGAAAQLGCTPELERAAALARDPGATRQRRHADRAGLAALPALLGAEFAPTSRRMAAA